MASNNDSGTSKVAAMKMMSHQQPPGYVHGTADDGEGMSRVGTVVVESVGSYLLRKTVGRNDPCPCGSGKKFKTCHSKMKSAIKPKMAGKKRPIIIRRDSTISLAEIDDEVV